MQALVSIIINCYNGASTLASCLQSVLAQSYTSWEVIFFDSASEDDSLSIARDFAQKDPRINCVAHATRPILGEARRLALTHAQGKYITFLDVDDLWHVDKLTLQVQHMQNYNHIDVLCTDADFFYGHNYGKKILRHSIFSKSAPASGFVFESLVQRQWMLLSSVMICRTALEKLGIEHGFDPQLQLAADADLLYRLAEQGMCDFLPQILTHRRMHEENITLTQWAQWPCEIGYILRKFHDIWPNFSSRYPQATKALQRRIAFQQAIDFWRQGKGNMARLCLKKKVNFSVKVCLFYTVTYFPSRAFSWVARNYWRLPSFFFK